MPSSSQRGDNDLETQLYTWGRNDCGQLALADACLDEASASPQRVSTLGPVGPRSVVHVDGSVGSIALLTADGRLFVAGCNDSQQLGLPGAHLQREAAPVQALQPHHVAHAAAGAQHMLAALASGAVVSWGSLEFGQLGAGRAELGSAPPLEHKWGLNVLRVAAGGNHSAILTRRGQVYTFGQGTHGALGTGDEGNRDAPTMLRSLWMAGIVQVTCGESHTVALGADGSVYTWGRGKHGQLGLGSFADSPAPQRVRQLTGPVVQVAAGGEHTLALGADGGVFAWGRGAWGQTGLGHFDNVCSPQRVAALAEQSIAQVSAGERHGLAVDAAGRVWAWGNNEEGQLGQPGAPNSASPGRVRGLPDAHALLVAAAGDHSAAVVLAAGQGPEAHTSGAAVAYGEGMRPVRLPDLQLLAEETSRTGSTQELQHVVEDMFKSVALFVATFSGSSGPPARAGGWIPVRLGAIQPAAVSAVYTSLLKVYDPALVEAAGEAACGMLDRMLQDLEARPPSRALAMAPPHLVPTALALLLLSPLNGRMPGVGQRLVGRLAAAVAALGDAEVCPEALRAAELEGLVAEFPGELLGARAVRPVHAYLSEMLRRQGSAEARGDLLRGARLLQALYLGSQRHDTLPATAFYCDAVTHGANWVEEYLLWAQSRDKAVRGKQPLLSLCQAGFMLPPAAKSAVLRAEAMLQMRARIHESSLRALVSGLHPGLPGVVSLDVRMRREHVVEDALNQIAARPEDLKKPLHITFVSAGVDEEGQDQGGVTKEFFQLLERELFNPAYGMMVYSEETRTYWFNAHSIEAETEFLLLGQMLGLAIYNGAQLSVQFPLVVYKKLLDVPVGFQDLKAAFPALGRGLQQLLDFEGDVEATFCRTFEVEEEVYGEVRRAELKPGGAAIAVTAANRAEFVELFSDYTLNRSIAQQFIAFGVGFHQVAGGPALSLFRRRPEELKLLICGLPHLDFEALQRAAHYEGGFSAVHPFIAAFWAFVKALPLAQKKQFLAFTTGSERAPVGGLGELRLLVQRAGSDSERLPSAHTCFNALLLPEYASPAKLAAKLTLAIQNAQGFGLQ